MLSEDAKKALRGFEYHGVEFHGESGGDNAYADCPFTDKKDKFYVNWKTRLWDSKTAGLSGNFNQFLEAISEVNNERYVNDAKAQSILATDRQLPRSAFKPWGIGWDGLNYTIPVWNAQKNKMVDLRVWRPKKKAMSTPGVSTGLFGAEQFSEGKRGREPVYICEGEWDCIALNWLLRKLGRPGLCVGVPGANTFKAEWVPLFKNREVFALYDADEPGAQGELRCHEMLSTACESIKYIRWPNDVPEGFDIRDWIVYGSIKKGTPKKCWQYLELMLQGALPRELLKKSTASAAPKEGEAGAKPKGKMFERPINHKELYAEFGKWLHLKTDEAIAITFGTVLANRLQGDPLWMFIVAPPGGMKSELLMSLSLAETIHACSSLTPHALVSGASWQEGQDPSLIPKLHGKVLVIKDFTTTLTMHPVARDEIFGQLRDCYDGKFEKQFGNGVIRRYKSTFGILAGVTPNIDAFSSLHQGLGERFLKFRLEGNLIHLDEEARILRAISNINREISMRDRLQEAAARFLDRPVPKVLPEFPPGIQKRLAKLAMLIARMRGVVNRDRYNASLLTSKSSYEIGTRLGKQLSKMAIGLALYYEERQISERIYKLVARVGVASAPDKIEEVIHSLWRRGTASSSKTKEVYDSSESLTQSTVFRVLQDLQMIGIVKQKGSGTKYDWVLTAEVAQLIRESQVYGDEEPEMEEAS